MAPYIYVLSLSKSTTKGGACAIIIYQETKPRDSHDNQEGHGSVNDRM